MAARGKDERRKESRRRDCQQMNHLRKGPGREGGKRDEPYRPAIQVPGPGHSGLPPIAGGPFGRGAIISSHCASPPRDRTRHIARLAF